MILSRRQKTCWPLLALLTGDTGRSAAPNAMKKILVILRHPKPDLQQAQQDILWAEHLAWVYPTWGRLLKGRTARQAA
jgi:hypothetical protein